MNHVNIWNIEMLLLIFDTVYPKNYNFVKMFPLVKSKKKNVRMRNKLTNLQNEKKMFDLQVCKH